MKNLCVSFSIVAILTLCIFPLSGFAQNIPSISANESGVLSDAGKVSVGITVTSPNGGQNLKTRTVYRIKWISSTLIVNLDYSTDNGVTWNTIIHNFQEISTYYDWTVPAVTSSNCLVRVSDASNPALNDVSDTVFSIYFPLSLLYPVAGDTLYAGENSEVRWTAVSMDSVKIEYSLNAGYTWNTAVSSTSAMEGSFFWTVPDTMSYQVRMRISDKNDNLIVVQTSNDFRILHSITVNSPNLGENIQKGRETEIRWSSTDVDSFYIKFSGDGGLTWSNIATVENDSSNVYVWRPNVVSQNCLIRIESTSTSTMYDQSDKKFSIYNPMTVTSPNGGESLSALRSGDITWNSTGIDSVKIEYSLNNGATWNTAASSFPASSALYNWSVPDTITSQALIKLSDKSDSLVYDISDSAFSITRDKEITLTSPDGGETWIAGSVHEIKWTNLFVDTLSVAYSVNNGVTWTTVNAKYPASSGIFEWTLPDTVSSSCLVKITSIEDSTVSDASDDVFSFRRLFAPTNLKAVDTGSDHGHSITLTWNLSADDSIIDGYRIYRSRLSTFSGPIDILSLTSIEQIIAIEQATVLFIDKVSNGENTYTDNFVLANGVNYYYWIQAYFGASGSEKIQSGITTLVAENPIEFRVDAPFPNPFNPDVTIRYQIPEKTTVKIRIYDYLGRTVAVLKDSYEEPGSYDARWNGRDSKGNPMASGVYFYSLEAGKFRDSGRMMLVK